MKRDIRIETTYPFPSERVWRALTDPVAMADWLMPNNFEARLGHKFQFRTKPAPGFDGVVECEVIELDPPHRLAFTWRGGGIDTVARFILEDVPEGTKLCFEHTGFDGLRGLMVSYILGNGWRGSILPKNLPAAVSRYTGDTYQAPLAAVKGEDLTSP
jgi:uncharacterized protein YndB with AHSA1/START domain